MCHEIRAVCTVMARCVNRVNPEVTCGDGGVLMDRGSKHLRGELKQGPGSVWNRSERPALSGWAKHCLMGLLEEQSE